MLPSILLLGVSCTLVTAQYQGIIETLSSVPELSELVNYLSNYPDLTVWLEELSEITFLAPNNGAFAARSGSSTLPSLPVDPIHAEELMSYHVLEGAYLDFSSNYYLQIPTAGLPYADANETLVFGGDVVVARGSSWSSAVEFTSGDLQISGSYGDPLNFTYGVIYIIDSFLTLPQTFKETTHRTNMLGGEAFADAVMTSPGTGGNVTIDDLSDVTIFLPMNYSLQEIGNIIENMSKPDFDRLVSYHIIDQVLEINEDSPPSGFYQTMEGTGVTIFSSNGFAFINNARVVGTPNWIFRGGMIYTIYGVLNPNNVTIDTNINDAEIAFAGAHFTPDFTFPTTNSRSNSPSNSSPNNGTVPATHSSSGGISTGAKAGIGAGLAVLLAIAIGACAFMRQRRTTKKEFGAETQFQHPYPAANSYPMKDLEVSISHEELVANAAKPARGPIKEFTPNVSVYSLNRDVKETSAL